MSTFDRHRNFAFEKAFGFHSFFEQQLIESEITNLRLARVIHEEKNLFRIQSHFGEERWAEVSGRLFFRLNGVLDLPSVGDWVLFQPLENSDRAVIQRVLQRQTCVYRKAVGSATQEQVLGANIDRVFIMTSLNQEFNVRRLDRYIVLCRESGAEPILVLTKRDLCSDQFFEDVMAILGCEYPGIPVVAVSAASGIGLADLESFLNPGKTIALLGSSGVGKSTLSNYLLGRNVLKTQEIRLGDNKGRHTTTGRHLFLLANGALILDTPGMREIQLLQHSDGVAELFDDIELLITKCKYTNCRHETEPHCAVQAAIEAEELPVQRWKSYLKLQREAAFQTAKCDKTVAAKRKESWKNLNRLQKQSRLR